MDENECYVQFHFYATFMVFTIKSGLMSFLERVLQWEIQKATARVSF
jgi:hypothetical protein